MGTFIPKDGDIIKYVSLNDPLKWSRWRIDGTKRICIDSGPRSSAKLGTTCLDANIPFNDHMWSIEASAPPMVTSAHPTLTQFLSQVRERSSDIKSQVSDETDKWQTWAHSAPGDCKCGIKRAQCEYHR